MADQSEASTNLSEQGLIGTPKVVNKNLLAPPGVSIRTYWQISEASTHLSEDNPFLGSHAS